MSRLAEVTKTALEHQPATDAIHDITDEACKTLERLDPDARLRRTGQFNHSFLPDVVVDWPRAQDRPVRPVYLRFDLGSELVDDVELLGGDGPMFLALSDSGESRPSSRELLRRELSDHRNTLVARPDALEAISETSSRDLLTRLVRSAVVQGGRGLLEQDDAHLVLDSAERAYEGAQSLQTSSLLQPLAVFNEAFVSNVASDAIKTIHMLWWASGGAPEEFPDSLASLFDVDDQEIARFLNYLFEQEPIEDASFWQRLGQRLSAATLLRLVSSGPTVNLQRLIEQNVARLRFKGVAADSMESRMPPLAQDFWWYVTRGTLVLAGTEFELTFVDDGRHFNSRSGGLPLGLDEVRRRVEPLRVESVEVDDERRVKDIRSKDHGDVTTHTSSIDDLLEGERGSVTEVTVRLPDGPRLRCNYERNSALIDDGDTSLAMMARFSSRLLLHLDADLQSQLTEYVRPRQDVTDARFQ